MGQVEQDNQNRDDAAQFVRSRVQISGSASAGEPLQQLKQVGVVLAPKVSDSPALALRLLHLD